MKTKKEKPLWGGIRNCKEANGVYKILRQYDFIKTVQDAHEVVGNFCREKLAIEDSIVMREKMKLVQKNWNEFILYLKDLYRLRIKSIKRDFSSDKK